MIYVFNTCMSTSTQKLLDDLCQFIKDRNVDIAHDTVVVACVREMVPEQGVSDVFIPAVKQVIAQTGLNENQIQFITNLTYPARDTNQASEYSNHTNLEFYCSLTYYLSTIAHPNNYSATWNSESDSALFLMGKPYKESRLGMLYMLTQRPVFRDLVYSFYGCLNSDILVQQCVELLAELDPGADYVSFAKKHQRILDIPTTQALYSREAYHYSGFPTDVSLYANTAFSVVAETSLGDRVFNKDNWITEKTWRAIANHHPFMILDRGSNHHYLNSLGITTFEKFYRHPLSVISNARDSKQMLSYYADNTQYFMDIKHKHVDEIHHMTEQNFFKFQQIADQHFAKTFNGDSRFRDDFFTATAHGNLPSGFTT
jgi:hypothetical protein